MQTFITMGTDGKGNISGEKFKCINGVERLERCRGITWTWDMQVGDVQWSEEN